MAFIRDLVSTVFVIIGIFPTLAGIMLAGEQFRVQQDLKGVLIGFLITLIGIMMILFGCWLSTRRTLREKYELLRWYENLQENYK